MDCWNSASRLIQDEKRDDKFLRLAMQVDLFRTKNKMTGYWNSTGLGRELDEVTKVTEKKSLNGGGVGYLLRILFSLMLVRY